jgi:hypothetical protein
VVLNSILFARDSPPCSPLFTDATKFGPSLVTLLYNTDNAMSFAVAAVEYELAYPCRGEARTIGARRRSLIDSADLKVNSERLRATQSDSEPLGSSDSERLRATQRSDSEWG